MNQCPSGVIHSTGYESKPTIIMNSRQVPVIAILCLCWLSFFFFTIIKDSENRMHFTLANDCIFNLRGQYEQGKEFPVEIIFHLQG